MKEDVIAANLANLRQSVNELKETVNKLNDTSQIMYRLPNQPLTNGRFTTVWQKVSATAGTMLCRY